MSMHRLATLSTTVACIVAVLIAGAFLFCWCTAGYVVHCKRSLPHGTTRGVCDGTPGSTYLRHVGRLPYCPVQVNASFRVLGSGVDTFCRQCEGLTGTAYSGTPMQCVVHSCQAENVVMKSQTCKGCSERDVAVIFPQTSVALNSTVVYINCPPGFTGKLRRTCNVHGWGSISGSCSRLRCPRLELPLPGRPRFNINDVRACLDDSRGNELATTRTGPKMPFFPLQSVLYHTPMADEAAEGDQVTISCPRPSYLGRLQLTAYVIQLSGTYQGIAHK